MNGRMLLSTDKHGGIRPLDIFVYGTLLRGEPNSGVVAGASGQARPAIWPDAHLLDLGRGYPGAIRGTGAVTGEVTRFSDEQAPEILTVLDHLEDYHGPGDPTNLYDREEVDVLSTQGWERAWIYIYRLSRSFGRPILDGSWQRYRAGTFLYFVEDVPGKDPEDSGKSATVLWPSRSFGERGSLRLFPSEAIEAVEKGRLVVRTVVPVLTPQGEITTALRHLPRPERPLGSPLGP